MRIGRGVEAMTAKSLREVAAKAAAAKSAGKPERTPIVVARPAVPLKPAQCRAWVRRTVAEHMPEVVEGFLNEAAKGGCGHLKMASETVASRPTGAGPRKGKGPEDLLMEELEREFGDG